MDYGRNLLKVSGNSDEGNILLNGRSNNMELRRWAS
jgi:hypothetical protein